MNKKYLLFEHAGAGNHGCEAIVRTTCEMLSGNELSLQTLNWNEDVKFGLDKLVTPIILKEQETIDRNSIIGLRMRIQSRLNRDTDYDIQECLYRNRQILLKNSVALSIGGDNYSYMGIIHSMRDKLIAFEKAGIPTVLWGCSVDQTHLSKDTISDLKKYNLITARESLTAEVLDSINIRDTVVQCADPAFTLKRQSVSWNDEIMNSGNVIGINVSDFMQYYNAYPDATYRNFYRLIEHILKATDCNVVLIPHVRHEGNDDLRPILQLARDISSNRVFCVTQDYNCMQLKDIIARCRIFVGCRTHSTISAYSASVPTLVVGYSIKARGICKDLFGIQEDLLVDVRNFTGDFDLVKTFSAFWDKENDTRKHLRDVMPEYCCRAYLARDALNMIYK